VATKVEGLFKKKRSYFTLDGKPLTSEQLDEMKRIASAKLKQETANASTTATPAQRSSGAAATVTNRPSLPSSVPDDPSGKQREPVEKVVKQATRAFFEKHGTSWTHQPWLEFLNGVRATVSAKELSDAEIGQILEAEAAAERQRRTQAAAAQTPKPSTTLPGLVTFQREERHPHPAAPHIQVTKRLYVAAAKDAAVEFLRTQSVSQPFYYIEVDTPFGKFGIDNGGRVYDSRGEFIEAEPQPEKSEYDAATSKIKAALESAMKNGERRIPEAILADGENSLRYLRLIIEDASADFYLRRMAVWWGGQFDDSGFRAFLNKRFVAGKDRATLYQRTESSRSEMARAEEGLHIASLDVLSDSWKP